MSQISVEEASRNLKKLLEQVATGEEVILVEEDRVVARLVPPTTKEQWLDSVRALRNSVKVKGETLSTTVITARQEERY
jgi:antitoxin (DNA-binding transcriptional repressor) of toxin-antitoxin stability system